MTTIDELASALAAGHTRALARAITLVEGTTSQQRDSALELLEKLAPPPDATRIAICGSPGVGKSTLINSLGKEMISAGHKVAVLAIDPASPISQGSILGDKTRMADLANSPQAFIRPSSARGHLGGVARRTREAIILCEACGFDRVLVETVGIGQSEHQVSALVDIVVYLQQPGSGDTLQAIKKGVLDVADLFAVTKNDGDLATAAKTARLQLQQSLDERTNATKVLLLSAIDGKGCQDLYQALEEFSARAMSSGDFRARRGVQRRQWFEEEAQDLCREKLRQSASYQDAIKAWQQQESSDAPSVPSVVAREFIDKLCAPWGAARD